MIRTQVICDRCGEICNESGASYYTFDIYAHDISPAGDGRACTDTAAQNLNQNIEKNFGAERHYCKKCVTDIKKFINEGVNR